MGDGDGEEVAGRENRQHAENASVSSRSQRGIRPKSLHEHSAKSPLRLRFELHTFVTVTRSCCPSRNCRGCGELPLSLGAGHGRPMVATALDELAGQLAANAAGRDWASAVATAEALAQQREQLTLGAWYLPFGTAVVLCAEASLKGRCAAPQDSAAGQHGAEPAPALPCDTPERLGLSSMRLLSAWFVLLVRYKRQHPAARLTAATTDLISRAVDVALTLMRRGPGHPHAEGHGPDSALDVGSVEAPAITGDMASTVSAPTLKALGVDEARLEMGPRNGRTAGGTEVAAAALATLGAGLELMDAKTGAAADHACLAALQAASSETSGPGASAAAINAAGDIWVLDEATVNDLLNGWVNFVTHTPQPPKLQNSAPSAAAHANRGTRETGSHDLSGEKGRDAEGWGRAALLAGSLIAIFSREYVADKPGAGDRAKTGPRAVWEGLHAGKRKKLEHLHLLTGAVQTAVVTGPLDKGGRALPPQAYTAWLRAVVGSVESSCASTAASDRPALSVMAAAAGILRGMEARRDIAGAGMESGKAGAPRERGRAVLAMRVGRLLFGGFSSLQLVGGDVGDGSWDGEAGAGAGAEAAAGGVGTSAARVGDMRLDAGGICALVVMLDCSSALLVLAARAASAPQLVPEARRGLDAGVGGEAVGAREAGAVGKNGGGGELLRLLMLGWLGLLAEGVLGRAVLRDGALGRGQEAGGAGKEAGEVATEGGAREGEGAAADKAAVKGQRTSQACPGAEEYVQRHVASRVFAQAAPVCRAIVALLQAPASAADRAALAEMVIELADGLLLWLSAVARGGGGGGGASCRRVWASKDAAILRMTSGVAVAAIVAPALAVTQRFHACSPRTPALLQRIMRIGEQLSHEGGPLERRDAAPSDAAVMGKGAVVGRVEAETAAGRDGEDAGQSRVVVPLLTPSTLAPVVAGAVQVLVAVWVRMGEGGQAGERPSAEQGKMALQQQMRAMLRGATFEACGAAATNTSKPLPLLLPALPRLPPDLESALIDPPPPQDQLPSGGGLGWGGIPAGQEGAGDAEGSDQNRRGTRGEDASRDDNDGGGGGGGQDDGMQRQGREPGGEMLACSCLAGVQSGSGRWWLLVVHDLVKMAQAQGGGIAQEGDAREGEQREQGSGGGSEVLAGLLRPAISLVLAVLLPPHQRQAPTTPAKLGPTHDAAHTLMAALLQPGARREVARAAQAAVLSYWAVGLQAYPRAAPLSKLATVLVNLMERSHLLPPGPVLAPADSGPHAIAKPFTSAGMPASQASAPQEGAGGREVEGSEQPGIEWDSAAVLGNLQRAMLRAVAAESVRRINQGLDETGAAVHGRGAAQGGGGAGASPGSPGRGLVNGPADLVHQGAELARLLAAAVPYVAAECVHEATVCLEAACLALPASSPERLSLVSFIFAVVSGGLEVERREQLTTWFLLLRRKALDLRPGHSRL